ncbi:hypothetical protein CC2G_003747 [Coprinopsis cinerea AmutBmut pab1-1]|nr:hypothetical protein CC2G_003747 [Coprinopsis cinerea AmutBmut pab1-1]
MTTGSMTVLQLARDSQFYYSAPASDTAPPSTQVNTEEYDSEWEEFVQGPSQSLADLETASQLLYNPLTKDCYFSTSPVSTPSTSPPPLRTEHALRLALQLRLLPVARQPPAPHAAAEGGAGEDAEGVG